MTRKLIPLGLAALVLMAASAGVLAAAGCGSSSGGGTDAALLAGTSWRLTGWSVSSQDPNDFTITADFKDGRIGGTSAVNQYSGAYTAEDGGSIKIGELAGTMMAGPEPDMQAEQTYLELLAGMTSFKIDGNELTLSDDQGGQLVYSTGQKE